jgi:hypothetical protein
MFYLQEPQSDRDQSEELILKTPRAAPPSRHRIHFSLRTLFMGIVILSIGLASIGQPISTIRHRRALLQQISDSGGLASFKFGCVNTPRHFQNRPAEVRASKCGNSIPALRFLLGDRPIGVIMFDRKLTDADEQIIAAFPEARIMALPTSK